MTCGAIEISVGDVSDVEARVYARFRDLATEPSRGTAVRCVLRGTLRGPYCEYAHTLATEFTFRELESGPAPLAEVVVPDPCTWSPELPHLYRADLEARQGERVVAEYHGMIGLRQARTKKDDET